MEVHPDLLLQELQRGDREGFVRYFELHRAPVHDLVRRLLHDAEEAVPATKEVFTRLYRRILLHDGPLNLPGWTYRAAIDVCRERLSEREADHGAAGEREADGREAGGHPRRSALGDAVGADWREPSDLGRRFAQALEMVEFRHQAALLLHDVNGLRPAELATVFSVTEDAATALLFRAREAFRRAFEELSSGRRVATCRLAEQMAAGAVGRGLSEDEARRLDEHAGYCRECRRAMKGWGGGAVGLALFLGVAPLPLELMTTPVFGTTLPVAGAANAVACSGAFMRVLAQMGRSLTSRAAAYALAAVCLAVSVGLAVHQSPGDRAFILMPAARSRGPVFVQPAAIAVRPSTSRSGQTVATSALSAAGSPTSVEPYAGATGSAVTVIADVGPPSVGGRPTVGYPVLSAAGAVTLKGDTKGDAKASKDGHVSAHPGRSGGGNGGHAKPAGTNHGKAATHPKEVGKQHQQKAKKDDAGKHQERTKIAKNH